MHLTDVFDTILRFLGRVDVLVVVMTTAVVLALTYYYMARGDVQRTKEHLQTDEEILNEALTMLGPEYARPKKLSTDKMASGVKDNPPPLENEKGELVSPSQRPIDNKLFDAQDIEMMKKCKKLDTKNPSEVKHYYQELRTLSYKEKNLSHTEKELEEQKKREQLSQIFALMNQQKEKFGETTYDDLTEQMSLYNQ